MNPDDDPEKRIRDLERPLTDQTRELGVTGPATGWPPPPPPPPPGYYGQPMPTQTMPPLPAQSSGPRIGWIVLVLLVVGLFAGGGAIVWSNLSNRSSPGIPTISGGGGTFTTATRPGRTTVTRPLPGPVNPEPPTAPAPGTSVSIAGVDQNKTIACDDGAVTISGMDNTIVITGHCDLVQVSGMNNVVTIDVAETIDVSGMDNKVTYRGGSPKISKSGFDNTVEQD